MVLPNSLFGVSLFEAKTHLYAKALNCLKGADAEHHESLGSVTPADSYFGRASDILAERNRIERQTIENRRLQHLKIAA